MRYYSNHGKTYGNNILVENNMTYMNIELLLFTDHYITILQYYNITILQYYNITILQYYNITILNIN